MAVFILKRLFQSIVTLFLIITATFFLMRSIPGSPFDREQELPPEIKEKLEEQYNLNDPLFSQYTTYLGNIAKFDLGYSIQRKDQHINDILKNNLPVSAKIGGLAALVVLIAGIPLGIVSALKRNKWPDYVVTLIATLGVTIPSFVLATFFIYIFSSKLKLIPAFGLSSPQSYIGPVIALCGFSLAFVARLMRSSLLEVMQQDYIRTARAKGISSFRVISVHALKNAIIPVITYVGPMVASILTGSFVVEKVFAIPGMGEYFVKSVESRDYPVIMGVTIIFAALYIISVLIVDVIYALIDPRIKY